MLMYKLFGLWLIFNQEDQRSALIWSLGWRVQTDLFLACILTTFLLAIGQKILTEIRPVIFLIVCVGLPKWRNNDFFCVRIREHCLQPPSFKYQPFSQGNVFRSLYLLILRCSLFVPLPIASLPLCLWCSSSHGDFSKFNQERGGRQSDR